MITAVQTDRISKGEVMKIHPPASMCLVAEQEDSTQDVGQDEVVVRLQGVISDLSLPPIYSALPG